MSNLSPDNPKQRRQIPGINPQAFVDFSSIHLSKRTSLAPPDLSHAQLPRFKDGESLRWRGTDGDTDWGVVIGRFYGYAPHSGKWEWCYLLWLASGSKSAAWCQVDTAWEEDLEVKS